MKTAYSLMLFPALLAIGGGWTYLKRDSAAVDMTAAADKFIATLSAEQKTKALMPYDSPKRVGWHFIPLPERKGLQIKEMDETQRKAAHLLLQAGLSKIGYGKATQIMGMEKLLRELEKGKTGTPIRDHERYYFTVFGEPKADARWGLSIEGHHLSLNWVIEKNEVIASTPQVLAAHPATVMGDYAAGPKKGTRILADEEELGFALVKSFTDEQMQTVLIDKKAPADVRAAGKPQPPTDKPVGLAAAKMTSDQQAALRKLLDVYANTMPADVAKARFEAIDKAGFDKIQFAWAGPREAGIGHYYRIEGPTFQVEFCNVQPDAAGNPANHIHCMWRDAAGDFAIPLKKD